MKKKQVVKKVVAPVELKDCDCMDKTKQLIIDRAIADEKNTKDYKIIEADWEYKSWYPKVRLYVNFIIKSTFIKKDGSTSKPKNSHASIFFSYCPFCGKKYPVMPKYDLVEVKPEEKK